MSKQRDEQAEGRADRRFRRMSRKGDEQAKMSR